ncbi:MAG: glycoside hydrolase family 92 protein [Bacteroidales bacterium]|nr:glycoside hydrolase family 92 protein [Bacteroidales bacterium]
MKKVLFLVLCAVVALVSCDSKKDYTALVDPYIGSGGHGHIFVGASVPFGMVQLGPHQIKTEDWDWCSGYHYSDTLVIGFSHTHLTGTGCSDLGDILFMPYNPEKAKFDKRHRAPRQADVNHLYATLDHSLECVKPGLYTVQLPDYGVNVRLTTTERTGLHEYTFTGDNSAILVDLCTGIGWEHPTEWKLEVVDSTEIRGYRRSEGWAHHIVYFVAKFSEPFIGKEDVHIVHDQCATSLKFDTSKEKTILVKVGISAVSSENAAANLATELPGWDFNATYAQAKDKWNEKLGNIDIVPMDEKQQRIFYTSMYHLMIAPSLFSDVNGDYRGADGKNHNDTEKQYTMLSLWDTYRAAYPLFTLIDEEMSASLVSTFMNIYEQQGTLPIWHLQGWETNCMPGNPAVIILSDLCLKGYVKDIPAALEAMKKSSMRDDRGVGYIKEYGFIPHDKSNEREEVSRCMEHAIADASLAKVAKMQGDADAAEYFGNRSKSWEKYYDPAMRLVRARNLDGSWKEPFDPYMAKHHADFSEGNAWQYTWLVPHDVQTLVDTLGGPEAFTAKLDSFFVDENGRENFGADVTGLIGQYAHGNEPSHHIVYLYNYVGHQEKCAEKVRRILNELYFDDHSGVCGNEDAGQMSAWYILSALGFYQVDPAAGEFQFGSPLVHKAVMNVGNGKQFTVIAHNNSMENIYIQEAKLNGAPIEGTGITYEQIKAGGVLEFTMGPAPVK